MPSDLSLNEVLTIAIAIFFGVFFLAPILAANPDLTWVGFIDKYQTLITGIMAILAAYISVYKMHWAELRQQSRHEEAVAVSMRKTLTDISLVKLTLDPIFERLMKCFPGIFREGDEPAALKWDFDRVTDFSAALYNIHDLLEKSDDPAIVEARKSLVPEDEIALRDLLAWSRLVFYGADRENFKFFFTDDLGVPVDYKPSMLHPLAVVSKVVPIMHTRFAARVAIE